MNRRTKIAVVLICLLAFSLLVGVGLTRRDGSSRVHNYLHVESKSPLDTSRYHGNQGQLDHPLKAQPPDPNVPLEESSPAYSSYEIQAIVEKVLPLVENITGRRLKHVPEIKLVTRKQFISKFINEQKRQTPLKNHTTQQKEPNSKPHLSPYVDYAFGVYIPQGNILYLLPGNFRPRLNRAGVPSEYHEVILMMIVAHELTHALQNQEVWSVDDSLEAGSEWPPDNYSPKVARAIMEGQATFVMERVAEDLDFGRAVPEFQKTISVGLILYTDPKCPKENEEFRKEERATYLIGKRFIEWHYQHGGKERVWQILKDPPENWSEIENPEIYDGTGHPS